MNNIVPLKEMFSSIQGEGENAGRRQIFIRLTGCNLACAYCDTDHIDDKIYGIETEPGSGIFCTAKAPLNAATLCQIIKSWCNQLPFAHHSITITGGEPLIHGDLLLSLLPMLRSYLPVYLETNGTLFDELSKVVELIDGISMDIKLLSTSGCEIMWKEHKQFLDVAIKRPLAVKLVVGETTTVEEIMSAISLLADCADSIQFFLQPLTNRDAKLGISAKHLLKLQSVAALHIPNVRVIPQMHLMMGAL